MLPPSTLRGDRIDRRGFLAITGISSVAAVLGVVPVAHLLGANVIEGAIHSAALR